MSKTPSDQPTRSESFVGIHFDFHARDYSKNIGANTTREMIEAFLNQVKPDYVQIDCKGCRGLCSYPTKVGNPAPGVVKDQLKLWRQVTDEHSVPLICHYCGVWDMKCAVDHPEWARIDENGEPDKDMVSIFSPFVDKLLIPQFKELCDDYGVDGVWVDADCWCMRHDYRPDVIERFQKETGINTIPISPDDPYFYEFSQFLRKSYNAYLKHYIETLREHNPNFSICCNWAFSSHMPEKVTIDVDYLSGDYKWYDSVNSARFEGRVLQNQGKNWDLMAWSFNGTLEDECFSTKTVIQMKREAAVVLAMGGGFQHYFRQNQDASIMTWQIPLMAKVTQFCRDRQACCHHAQPVHEIAMLFSTSAYRRRSKWINPIWNPDLEPIGGVLQMLLDRQNHVEIILEHHVADDHIDDYFLIIVPEWEPMDQAIIDKLIAYVNKGGNLLIIGPKAARQFESVLDVEFVGEPEQKHQWLDCNGWLGGMNTLKQVVKPGKTAQIVGKIYNWEDYEKQYDVAATITPCGKGKIAAIYINLGRSYYNSATPASCDFLNVIVRELFPNPMVTVSGSRYVDLTVNHIDGKLAVNLVNTAGPHANKKVWVHDDIPPVGPLTITVCIPQKPKSITCQPDNIPLDFNYTDGKAVVILDKLEIHNILMVE